MRGRRTRCGGLGGATCSEGNKNVVGPRHAGRRTPRLNVGAALGSWKMMPMVLTMCSRCYVSAGCACTFCSAGLLDESFEPGGDVVHRLLEGNGGQWCSSVGFELYAALGEEFNDFSAAQGASTFEQSVHKGSWFHRRQRMST